MQENKSLKENSCDAGPTSVSRRELPVLGDRAGSVTGPGSRKWRAAVLLTLTALMVVHYVQWRVTGTTVSPIEPSESMYTLASGAVNAGFIFFTLAILATLILGRWVCGWGCHIVALQDLCAWMLRKVGVNPKPFRSRLLVYVPLLAAAYMFLWPIGLRIFARPVSEPLVPQFTNHLITTDFWATFPGIAVAIPFLFICGFVTVYFLGAKGFCTYGCPYGGVFVIADKFAPARIRVTDACDQCGECTAACTANVQVHLEVREYGMVTDPGCMKHMDCVSACPKDALYFGFGKLAVGVKKTTKRTFSLSSWPEEILAAIVFLASFFAVWDTYQLVPMLMALGIAPVTTFLVMRTVRLLKATDQTFSNWMLRTRSKLLPAGLMFAGFAGVSALLVTHSGYIRYQEFMGRQAFSRIAVPDELGLAQVDPAGWLSADERANVDQARLHLSRAFDGGFFVNSSNLQSLAWTEFVSGNAEQAINLLRLTAARQIGRPRALTNYYRGAILNRLGRHTEALTVLDEAIEESPDLVKGYEERGVSLWNLGRTEEAIEAWQTGFPQNTAVSNYLLVGALTRCGRANETGKYLAAAERATPDDPYFRWMLGLRLSEVKMNELAEEQFQRAVQLDSKFILRRKPR